MLYVVRPTIITTVNFINFINFVNLLMVPKAGLEPAHPKAVDFESTASTNFATSALRKGGFENRQRLYPRFFFMQLLYKKHYYKKLRFIKSRVNTDHFLSKCLFDEQHKRSIRLLSSTVLLIQKAGLYEGRG